MEEQGGLNESRREIPERGQNQHADVTFPNERSLRTTDAQETNVHRQLQELSGDRPVVLASELSKLSPEQLAILKDSIKDTSSSIAMIDLSIRTKYNRSKFDEMNGTENADNANHKYMGKMVDVANENIKELTAGVKDRLAFPIQSFNPGPGGQVKAETLYAFFPPLQPAALNELYITFQLHSPDPRREAQIRRDSSAGYSLSSHEFDFNCKKIEVNGVPLLERRNKAQAS